MSASRASRDRPRKRASARRLRFSAAAAYRHLREADPVVGALIEQHGPYRPRPSGEPYAALVRSIMYQQLAGPAAAAILGRLNALHGDADRIPTAEELLSTSEAQFREAGVSRQKTRYLRDLAEQVAAGRLRFRGLDRLDDATVIERLTGVKGVGEWTAQMFLMFQLGRPDVLPAGDLGVRRGMQLAYGLREPVTPAQAQRIGEPWAPYRSVGSWYMWRVAETQTPA